MSEQVYFERRFRSVSIKSHYIFGLLIDFDPSFPGNNPCARRPGID